MRALILLALVTASGSPEETARQVHRDSNHPGRVEIVPGPRWTDTYAPLESGGSEASNDAVPAPQQGGGHASDEDDGWEGDRWIDPNAAPSLNADNPGPGHREVGVIDGIEFDGAAVGGGGLPYEPRPPSDPEYGGGGGSVGDERPSFAQVQPDDVPPDAEPGPELEPEPEPEVEPEPLPEPEPEPEEPEPEPLPEPEIEAPPPTPPAVGVVSEVSVSNPQPPPPDPLRVDEPPPVDHRPFWFTLLGIASLAAITRAYRWFKKAKPATTSARPAAKTAPAQPPQPSAVETTQSEFDYAAEIRTMLRAGLIAVGWHPQGRELSKTARELSAGLSVGDPRRDAVHRLVAVAEKVRFAGAIATPEDYHRACRCLEEILQRKASA